ncbi:MAG: hypothetical protein SH850_26025 [Planctomycetaceae bacterium]|nr:hypothetical protein [Planctomycetaceae bacterium]
MPLDPALLSRLDQDDWQKGAVHCATQSPCAKDLLLVFVHGIFADFRSTWADTPARILEGCGFDADYLMFAHPAKLWHQASVQASATKLHERIASALNGRRHRNIVFIAHSLGGLVVKELLCREARIVLNAMDPDRVRGEELRSIWTRTRLVMAIDVPDQGGHWFLSTVGYPAYTAIVGPAVWLIGLPANLLLRNRVWPWGWDEQLGQLRTGNRFVGDLEQSFQDQTEQFRAAALPSSYRHRFSAQLVTIVKPPRIDSVELDETTYSVDLRLPAGGTVRQVAGDHSAAIVESIPSLVETLKRHYAGYPDYQVAERTLGLLLFDPAIRVDSLIGRRDDPVSQAGILRHLQNWVATPRPAGVPAIKMLVADAALGKSTVVRCLVRLMSLEKLRRGVPKYALLFPLHRIKLERKDRAHNSAALWQSILKGFCGIAAVTSVPDADVTPEWVDAQLHQAEVLLVLDGIEELLMNNPLVERAAAVQLANHLNQQYGSNPGFRALLTVRKTYFNASERSQIAPHSEIPELQAPSHDDLSAAFPWMSNIFGELHELSPEVDRLLRSPLIAKLLKPRDQGPGPASGNAAAVTDQVPQAHIRFRTESDVFDYCLRAMLKWSRQTLDPSDPCATLISDDVGFEVLSATGWCVFSKYGAVISADALKAEVKAKAEAWQAHLESLKARGGSPGGDEAATLLERRCLARMRPEVIDRYVEFLLRRTVFTSIDGALVKVVHREIADYLAAGYLARCLEFRKLDDLAERGGTVRVFELAAQIIDGMWSKDAHRVFTSSLVGELQAATVKTGNRMLFGNAGAVAAQGLANVADRYFTVLWDELFGGGMDPMIRHIILSGLGYRAIRWDPDDGAAEGLRDMLIQRLPTLCRDATIDVVTRSMAWCYYRGIKGQSPDGISWADLDVSAKGLVDGKRTFFDPPPPPFEKDTLNLAWQIALEELLQTFHRFPARPVSVAHYILAACAAYGQLRDGLQVVIRNLLNRSDENSRLLFDDPTAPELKDVMQAAKALANLHY